MRLPDTAYTDRPWRIHEIVRDFSVGFTIYDSYDNRPPSADASKNDVGLSLTIGWTF